MVSNVVVVAVLICLTTGRYSEVAILYSSSGILSGARSDPYLEERWSFSPSLVPSLLFLSLAVSNVVVAV